MRYTDFKLTSQIVQYAEGLRISSHEGAEMRNLVFSISSIEQNEDGELVVQFESDDLESLAALLLAVVQGFTVQYLRGDLSSRTYWHQLLGKSESILVHTLELFFISEAEEEAVIDD